MNSKIPYKSQNGFCGKNLKTDGSDGRPDRVVREKQKKLKISSETNVPASLHN